MSVSSRQRSDEFTGSLKSEDIPSVGGSDRLQSLLSAWALHCHACRRSCEKLCLKLHAGSAVKGEGVRQEQRPKQPKQRKGILEFPSRPKRSCRHCRHGLTLREHCEAEVYSFFTLSGQMKRSEISCKLRCTQLSAYIPFCRLHLCLRTIVSVFRSAFSCLCMRS